MIEEITTANLAAVRLTIGREISAFRMLVPECNRKKYDIESEDHFRVLTGAVTGRDSRLFHRVVSRWRQRVEFLQHHPEACRIPPALVWMEGEPAGEYLERCYEKWSY